MIFCITTFNGSQCILCPHNCVLKTGQIGKCKIRQATENSIINKYEGLVSSITVDPIEKKPIYHYKPNSKILSISFLGCNNFCSFCENFNISQKFDISKTKYFSSEGIIELAKDNFCDGICFTYNEPTIHFEYILDLSEKCYKNNLFTVLKTNGYLNSEPWIKLLNYIDVFNIDYKGNKRRYEKIVGVKVGYENVIENIIETIDKRHLEISIPIYGDSYPEEYIEICNIISQKNKNIPIHLLKIIPAYKMINTSSVSNEMIFNIKKEIQKQLNFVYIHNVFSEKNIRNTICPISNETVISRDSLISKIHNKEKIKELGIAV